MLPKELELEAPPWSLANVQKKIGLPPDGLLGPGTLDFLGDKVRLFYNNPKTDPWRYLCDPRC